MSGKAFFLLRLNDHVQYLKKIQATLEGKGDFQGTDHLACKLGEWLYGEGATEADSVGAEAKGIFDSLIEPHQRFHEASKRALEKGQQGDTGASNEAVTEMHKLSNTLVDKLLTLDKLSH
jgi:hypothetical protein